MILIFGLQRGQRFAAFAQDLFFPSIELTPEIFALAIAHEGLAF